MNISLFPKQTGVGLIETLLIVLFVSVSIIALVNFQHYLSFSSNQAQQQFDATIIANQQLETLRDFQVLNTTAGYKAYADIASGSSTKTVGNTLFNLAWTVTTNTNPNYKTIDITVSWTDRFSTSRSVRLVTQVAGIDPASAATIK